MVMNAIGDMVIRLKNAGDARKESLVLPYSKFRASVLEVLEKEGYIKSYSKKGKKVSKSIEVALNYREDEMPRIQGVEQVSRLSKHIYTKSKEAKSVKHGHGLLVLSTSKGILTDKQARKANVGGQALFKIW